MQRNSNMQLVHRRKKGPPTERAQMSDIPDEDIKKNCCKYFQRAKGTMLKE